MKDGARIEVHWATNKGEARRVTIRPDSGVTAIILNGPVTADAEIPPGIEVEFGKIGPGDGPLVCYEINGQLHCW